MFYSRAAGARTLLVRPLERLDRRDRVAAEDDHPELGAARALVDRAFEDQVHELVEAAEDAGHVPVRVELDCGRAAEAEAGR